MSFGMSNALSTLRVITHGLRPFIGKFLVVCFDDILVYNKTRAEYLDHFLRFFLILHTNKLFTNLKKCSFMQNQVLFLGFIMFDQGISTDTDKVKAIRKWPEPKTLSKARNFHGLVFFYKQFIKGFNTIIVPITEYLKLGSLK